MLSYPTLDMFTGGLAVRVRATISALRARGIDCALINPYTDQLSQYDLVHVFGAINGTYQIVRAAKSAGLPVVLSSVLVPPWTKWDGIVATLCDRVLGRLTGWGVRTNYREIKTGLHLADRVVALGNPEKDLLVDAFDVDASAIRIIPNGIEERFFGATPDLFRAKIPLARDFVLCVASVSHFKNQLNLIAALKDFDLDVVLIGGCDGVNREYLNSCLALGDAKVRYLGYIDHDDPLLASAFAAARVFALPSVSEGAPTAALEALASGTPTVLTKFNSLDLEPYGTAYAEVNPRSVPEIRAAVDRALRSPPPRPQCSDMVKNLRWDRIAAQTIETYQECLALMPNPAARDSRGGFPNQ
ncbi:MAG: glycosyltransferase family 4 protein [Alphaproteobacteria bacterium]